MNRAPPTSDRGAKPAREQRFPARLHVLLAREALTALVIRRGPAKSVCTLLWDRRKDAFTLGQWLRGRIYERRCDLSPDGRYLIYFARNSRWQSETGGAWTAISRVPYLKAITLFAKGDCWHGGGLFLAARRYWLNDGSGHRVLRNSSEVQREADFEPGQYFGAECTGVYYLRLQRDGWRLVKPERIAAWHHVTLFEKKLQGGWTLLKRAHEQVGAGPGRGCYWDEHELQHPGKELKIDGQKWEWADMDGNRLVWTEAGTLRSGWVKADGLADEHVLFDFNDMTFEPVAAPY